MSMPLQTRSYQTDLYSQALSAIYSYWDRVRDPSYAMSHDVDIYEIMSRDPKVFQGIQDRLTSVAGPDWRVFPFNNSKDPNDIALAKLVDDAFRFVPHFPDTRMRLATAIFRGQSCELMTGKRKKLRLGGIPTEEMFWMFNETKNIDPRRFTIRPLREKREDGSTKIGTELWMSTIPMFNYIPPIHGIDFANDRSAMSGLMPYGYKKVEHPEWLIRVIYQNDEAHLGWGNGLYNCLYFFHWIKQILLREGLQGVERWSQGIVVGTLDNETPGEPDTQTTENEKTAMLSALEKMRSRHVYVQGKHDDIEVVTGGGEGHQMVMGMIDYVDDCIMAVCTGAVLMSSKSNAGDAGSHARDEVGANTQNKIVASDQKKIDEDISAFMVGLWVRQNWRLVCKYGMQHARLPQVKTVQPETANPNEFATRLSTVWQANSKFKVRKDEAYEKLGLTPVNEQEDEWVEGNDPGGEQAGMAQDPSQMMMEGSGSPPAPAAMRSRNYATADEIMARLEEKMAQFEGVIAAFSASARPSPQPQPITMNSAPVTVNAPAQPPAEVVVHNHPAPIMMNIEAPKPDAEQHAETMAAHERSATANMLVAEKLDAILRKETPATVVNVAPPTVEFKAGDVYPPEVHVRNVVQVPAQAAPMVNMKAGDVFVTDQSAKPLGRIAEALEGFFGWFKKKPAKKIEIDFKHDKQGAITKAEGESK